jgi:hypothetical protein
LVSISDSDLVELSDAFDWGFFGLMNSGGHLFGKTAVIGRSSVQRPEIVITDSGGPRSDTPGSEHRKANLKSGHDGGSTPVPGRDARSTGVQHPKRVPEEDFSAIGWPSFATNAILIVDIVL